MVTPWDVERIIFGFPQVAMVVFGTETLAGDISRRLSSPSKRPELSAG